MKYILLLLFLLPFFIGCEDNEYYDCLEKVAKSNVKEIISNIRNHSIKKNLPIVYQIYLRQISCALDGVPSSSIDFVRDYIYKDIYEYVFQSDSDLFSIIDTYWSFKSKEKTIEECYPILQNKLECEELYDSFRDYLNH